MATKNQMTGMLGVYLTAAELTEKGFIVSTTSRSARGADLLATDQSYKTTWSVQVKTNGKATTFWLLNKSFKDEVSETHVYVFVNLKGERRPEYYIVPSKFVADNGVIFKSSKGGLWYSFDLHRTNAEQYRENWSIFTGEKVSNDHISPLKLAKSFFQAFNRESPRLFDKIVSVLFESNPSSFFKTHYVTVNGTNQALIRFEFDADAFWLAFDAEFSVALRTMRLEYPRRNNISHVLRSNERALTSESARAK
jgi:hypothetical protein